MPKVSVLVPLYNTNSSHLKEMIESVLNQIFTDFELILLNDSPDNQELAKIVSSYRDDRIIYKENSRNMGISASRNRLLEIAKGEYLAILDHDDICVPDRLEREVSYLDENPNVGVCSGWLQLMSNNKQIKTPEENDDIKELLMSECAIVHSAAMIRKSVLEENNICYEEMYSPAEDYMLWIRLLGVTMFYNIQAPMILYRDHADNTSNRQKKKMQDKGRLVRCIAYREYLCLLSEKDRKKVWFYLFGKIPVLKVKMQRDEKIYLLFGILPILSRRVYK